MNETKNNKYDLEERTAQFGEKIIKLAKKIPKTAENFPIINQLVRAGTSIGSNYCEATEAESKKDFSHKISISKKESKETKYWLRIVAVSEPQLKEEAKEFWREAHELNLIFGKIKRSSDKKIIDNSII